MSVRETESCKLIRISSPMFVGLLYLLMLSCPVAAEDREAEEPSAEQSRVGLDFVVAIDATESMQYATDGSAQSMKLDLARTMAADILDLVPVGARCTVLVLQDDVSTIRPLEPLQAGDRSRARRAMAALLPSGHGELRNVFLHVEQLLSSSMPADEELTSGNALRNRTQPFLILITDGEDCRPGEAHGVAAQLKRQFPGLKCLLPGVCKAGSAAAQLQSLALAAAGDSPNLISEDGISVALDSVREACDSIRAENRQRLLAAEDGLRRATEECDRANLENERLEGLLADFEKTADALKESQRQFSIASEKAVALKDNLDALTLRHDTLATASEATRARLEDARVDVARLQAEAAGHIAEIEDLQSQLAVAEEAHADASTRLTEQSTLKSQLTDQLDRERAQVQSLVEKDKDVTIPVVSDLLMLLGLGGAGWVTLKKHATGLLTSVDAGLGEQKDAIIRKQEAATERLEQERVARVDALQNSLNGLSQQLDRLAFRVEESIPSTIQNAAGESRAAAELIRADLADVKVNLHGELAAATESIQGRLSHLNDVAESKLDSRFKAVVASQATIEKLIEKVPESVTSASETQCQALHQAIDSLGQAFARNSDQTRGLIGTLADAENEHALAASGRLEATHSSLAKEVRDAAEAACSRLIAHETATVRELREWIGTQANMLAREQLQSHQVALHTQQERISSDLADAWQEVAARLGQQISEFRNATDPRIERLAEHLTVLRHLAQQREDQSSLDAKQLMEKATATLRTLQRLERDYSQTSFASRGDSSERTFSAGRSASSHVTDSADTTPEDSNGREVRGQAAEPESSESTTRQRRIWERQLKLVPGLGTTSARKLIQVGINTIHELATVSDAQLQTLADDFPKVREWSSSAAAIEELCQVRAIDEKSAVALLKGGVGSLRQLADLNDDEIQALNVSLPLIRDWVTAAKQLTTQEHASQRRPDANPDQPGDQ